MVPDLSLLTGDFQTKERIITVQNPGLVLICSQATDRWGLIFGSTASGGISSVTTDPNAITSQGIALSTSIPYWSINFRDWGALVHLAWYARISTLGTVVTIIEVFYRPRG